MILKNLTSYTIYLYRGKPLYFFSLKSALEKGKGRFVDGLADPLIAVLSDNCRARPGRRKVFLLASGLPLALTSRPFPAGNRQATGSGWGCCSLFFILLLPLM